MLESMPVLSRNNYILLFFIFFKYSVDIALDYMSTNILLLSSMDLCVNQSDTIAVFMLSCVISFSLGVGSSFCLIFCYIFRYSCHLYVSRICYQQLVKLMLYYNTCLCLRFLSSLRSMKEITSLSLSLKVSPNTAEEREETRFVKF